MKLAEYQRTVAQLCLARDAGARLSGEFSVYRQMIRARFEAMAQNAFRRSHAAVGDAAFAASFARYLELGPNSALIRDVIGRFGAYASADVELLAAAPAHTVDLVRFETAVWEAASDGRESPAHWDVRELDFDGVLVPNPVLRVLALTHTVSEDACTHDPHTLLVYRRLSEDDVHWYRAPDALAALLALHSERCALLGDHLRTLYGQRDAEAGETLLSELAAALSVAVERGVILGVRALD